MSEDRVGTGNRNKCDVGGGANGLGETGLGDPNDRRPVKAGKIGKLAAARTSHWIGIIGFPITVVAGVKHRLTACIPPSTSPPRTAWSSVAGATDSPIPVSTKDRTVNIHPTAVVSPDARIGVDVEIGPYCVIEADTVLGEGCVLLGHVTIKQGTTLGSRNRVFESAVLGGFPQHVHMPERPGRLVVGNGNTIRESVTIHRPLTETETTVVGDNNLIMVNAAHCS